MQKRLVAIFVLVIGAAGIVAGVTMLSASATARSWPVVPGQIVERSVGPSTTTGASRPGRYFEPRVSYRYTVDGKPYTGHRIALTTDAYDEDTARSVANGLPDHVDVHYNPRDPGDALLQPSSIGIAIIALIAGAIAGLVGAGILVASFTKK
jgi:Protein of unknown function (DUF3592)